MTDPIADLIGDYRAFTALQRDRLAARGHKPARTYELGGFRLGSRRHHSRTNRAEKRATAM